MVAVSGGGDSIDSAAAGEIFVPSWEVRNSDTFKRLSTCEEVLCGSIPPAERRRVQKFEDGELLGRMIGNAMKLQSYIPELIQRFAAVKEKADSPSGELEALRDRERELVEEIKSLKVKLEENEKHASVMEARAEMEKERRLAVEEEKISCEAQLTDIKATCDSLSTDRRWLIEEGFQQVVVYLLHSKEFNEPLADVYKKLVSKGRHDGLLAGFKDHEAGKTLEHCAFYNPAAHQNFVQSVREMERIVYPYLTSLSSSFAKPLSDIKALEPNGLDRAVADELLGTHKRKSGLSGVFSPSKKLKKAASGVTKVAEPSTKRSEGDGALAGKVGGDDEKHGDKASAGQGSEKTPSI